MIVQTHFSRHTVGSMHPRTVGRPPRRMPVCPRLTFHSNASQERRPQRAFTLIELLVVIAIIGILMGLLVPSLFTIYERARKTQAKNDLTQIITAVNAFYTEYGKYPLATGDAFITATSSPSNADLFYTLRAQPVGLNAGNVANPRQIVYISPRVFGTIPARSGIGSDGHFYDPWGTPYRVAIDGNYDNQITPNPYGDNTGAGPSPLPQGVIAWSLGKDQTPGNGGAFTGSDDVISWQ
jgi:prepilin-type N-terminal cleavage/methylation domain-containing protein